MEGPSIDGMDLDRRHEDRARLLPVDRQVHERVRAAVAAELLEFVGIDRDAGGVDPVAVDDARKAPGTTEGSDLLADDVAMFGGQRRAGGGHDAEPLDRMLSRSGLRLAGGAGKWRGAR